MTLKLLMILSLLILTGCYSPNPYYHHRQQYIQEREIPEAPQIPTIIVIEQAPKPQPVQQVFIPVLTPIPDPVPTPLPQRPVQVVEYPRYNSYRNIYQNASEVWYE